MTRLALVRHGQTDWNLERRIQGSSDIPLNAVGRAQARRTSDFLAGRHWDAVFSSPLSRAWETAEIIATGLGLASPTAVQGIQERSYGGAEGLTSAEITAKYPGDAAIPGRESRKDVVARALPALLRLAEEHPRCALVVVSHGAVIGSLVRHLTDHALPGPGNLIANGSVHEFLYRRGALVLDKFNQTPDDDVVAAAAP
ncbi:MAG TPA: histidine phosphatase family protein [Microbacteriaceae bacterium]|nr:histidine phosphatase family protein [Microbacteriaceae bacterium]